MTTSIIFFLVIAGLITAWVCYMLIKSHEVLEDMEETNAPYKVEPAEQLAVPLPHKPIEWTFTNARKPKRKYTKRSSFWTAKRKKAAASKAKKKTRKSK